MLDQLTLERLNEILEGRYCRCGEKAERFRLLSLGETYYCNSCFEELNRVEEKEVRVFASPHGLDQSEAEDLNAVSEPEYYDRPFVRRKKTRQRKYA